MIKHTKFRVSKVTIFLIVLLIGGVSGIAILRNNAILSNKAKIQFEFLPSEDTTPPEVTAAFIPIIVEEYKGTFEISFYASDETDSELEIIAILRIFLPVDWHINWDLEKEEDSKTKIEADYEDEEIEIKGPNPDEIYHDLTNLGGLRVDNGQILKIELEDDEIKIELFNYNSPSGKIELKNFDEDPFILITDLLNVTATDKAGNIGFAKASPSFEAEESTTNDPKSTFNPESTSDLESTSDSEWTIPSDWSNPSNWPTDELPSSGMELIPSLILLITSAFLLRRKRRTGNSK
ncbi:MAG: hypothetical protein ACFFAU_10630 [Candidatus Hodarchaeota archaeon]